MFIAGGADRTMWRDQPGQLYRPTVPRDPAPGAALCSDFCQILLLYAKHLILLHADSVGDLFMFTTTISKNEPYYFEKILLLLPGIKSRKTFKILW